MADVQGVDLPVLHTLKMLLESRECIIHQMTVQQVHPTTGHSACLSLNVSDFR